MAKKFNRDAIGRNLLPSGFEVKSGSWLMKDTIRVHFIYVQISNNPINFDFRIWCNSSNIYL